MPGMGGLALAEELRCRLPDLPVVLASGYSHVLAKEGSHGFELLHKPYSAEQLGSLLRQVTMLSSRSTPRALSAEVDTGSAEERASKQELRAVPDRNAIASGSK